MKNQAKAGTLRKSILSAAALCAAVTLAAPINDASAQKRSRVGVLECNISGGVGFVITSRKGLACAYRGADGRVERYNGVIRKFGLDIGFSGPGKMVWAVVAPARPGPGALTGEYVGASASASAGVGVGANALIGGAKRSINLQPLSVQAQTGVNITAGVSSIFLQYLP